MSTSPAEPGVASRVGMDEQPADIAAPASRTRLESWERWLFGLSLAVFLGTRLVGLADFPIYFFCDEAIQTVLASDLVNHGFRDAEGTLLPTYLRNGPSLNLSTSVYLQVVPYLLFGKSIFATRATSVLVALFGAVAVGLILRNIFRIRFWCAGVLLLSITPAWFLHSRTAFETVEATAFYAWFLYFYLRYRYQGPKFLFPALFFAALTFYTYSAIQIVVILTTLLLFFSDLRYHLKLWKTALLGLGFLLLLTIPYLRFEKKHPEEAMDHLRRMDSYWLRQDMTVTDKLERFGAQSAMGLSPRYWFIPENPRDLIRHRMKGYGNILWPVLPFALLGLLICVYRIRSSAHRALGIALLAAPAGGALVGLLVTRVLVFVVPATLLTALGLSAVLSRLEGKRPGLGLSGALFLLLSAVNVWIARDALVNGPTWYSDYGMGGMQWGARQVYAEIRRTLDRDQMPILLSHTWTNGADTVQRFFFDGDGRVQLRDPSMSVDEERLVNIEKYLFVVSAEDYGRLVTNPKLTDLNIRRILDTPDGKPGFYFLTMRYSPDAEAIFQREHEERRRPVSESFLLGGEMVDSWHSRFDLGSIREVFDGDIHTLARTAEANPAIIDLTFPTRHRFRGATVSTTSMEGGLRLRFTIGQSVFEKTFTESTVTPTVSFDFLPPPADADRVRIEVEHLGAPDNSKIHIKEIQLR